MSHHFHAALFQLFLYYRGKPVFDPPAVDFASCRDDPGLHLTERKDPENGFSTADFFHPVHLLLFDHKRDYAHTYDLISLFHREVPVSGSKHHLPHGIHCI